MILEKFFVTHRGDPFEFGRRLYAEAVRRGLHQAKKVYGVADGGVWIWKIKEDRFPDAEGGLDFYHAHAAHSPPRSALAKQGAPALHVRAPLGGGPRLLRPGKRATGV